MKIRLLAVPAIISALFMLIACGSGTNNILSAPFAPTVTVTAPATAVAGSAFTIDWSSTGADSCAADFDSGTGTTGSVSKTETTAGNKTYSVTCTGAGGSATNSTTVQIINEALPQGLWQGNNSDGRSLSGVITKEGDYWLAYTRSTNDSTIVGFYAGRANSTQGTPPNGTLSSTNLREVNFDTGFSGGNTAAGTISSASYSSKQSVSGSFDSIPSSPSGNWIINVVTETGSSSVHTQTSNGSGSLDTTTGVLTLHTSGNFLDAVGLGVNDALDITETYNGTINGTTWTPDGTGSYLFSNCVVVSGPNFCGLIPNTSQAVNSVAGSVIRRVDQSDSTINASITMIVAGGPVTLNITDTLTVPGLPSIPSIAAGTFNLGTYNSLYEATPSLDAIAGSYTMGATGIDTIYNDASLTIASDGSIAGTESVSHCNYTATIAAHPTGNVYDVTALIFTGNSCIYSTNGTFTGVATLDATATPAKLILTALNSNRDKGFMVVATKP